ncbi:MAG: GTPase domain-containing protein [Acidobacteriota bacterium]
MVFFNYALRKLNAKIVYYGPGLCGKTTNLQWIHDHFEGGQRGKMISLATEGDRTIFFDLLPLEIGTIRGMQVTLQLYTVPGQVHYNSTRQLVLRGADGVVFVADSQRTMQTSNLDSFKNLQENMLLQGINLEGFPLVLQFNKRDLRDLISTEELDEQLNNFSVPIFEAIATDGVGVQETLEGIVKLVMRSLRERYEPVTGAGAVPQSAKPAPATAPPAARQAEATPPASTSPVAGSPFEDEPAAAAAFPPGLEPPPMGDVPAASTFEDEVNTAVYGLGEEGAADDAPAEQEFDIGGIADEVLNSFEEPEVVDVDQPPDFEFGDSFAEPPEPAPVVEEVEEIDEPFAEAETASGIEVSGVGKIAIGDDSEETPEAATPPPAADHYEDRIDAPSPFVPHREGETAALPEDDLGPFGAPQGDGPAAPAAGFGPVDSEPDTPVRTVPPDFDEPPQAYPPAADEVPLDGPPAPYVKAAEAGDWEDSEVSDDVRLAFGAGENREALASLLADEAAAAEAMDVAHAFEAPPPQAPEEAPAEPEFEATPAPVPEEALAEAAADEPPPPVQVEAQPAAAPAIEHAYHRPPTEPIMVGEGDPFAEPELEPAVPAAIEPALRREVDVRAEDNQLHLRLQGTGAIVESGQVRALDIEVPVPGSWVGNRRVTLQLRLTLSPVAEEEDGGPGKPS